jgi:hypothetical protein
VAARSNAWIVLARSNAGIVGSNPTQRDGCLCVCLFCVRVVLVDSGLTTGWSPIKGGLPPVWKRLRNWRRGHGPKKGLRAVDEWMNKSCCGYGEYKYCVSVCVCPYRRHCSVAMLLNVNIHYDLMWARSATLSTLPYHVRVGHRGS